MTKTTLTLAAALLAGTTLSSAANAGGVRVGFGFPLGSFVAHEHQNYTPAPTSNYRAEKHCDKPVRAARHEEREEAPVRKAHRPAPKVEVAEEAPAPRKIKRAPKVEVAEEAPAPRKIKRAPKVEVAEEEAPAPRVVKVKAAPAPEPAPAPVQVAKLEDNTIQNDATPSVYVPETPVVTNFTGTQSTPAVIRTASIAPAVIKDEVKVDEPKVVKVEKVEKTEKDEPKAKIAVTSEIKRLCRRFSAAIAGLIDVPCE
jgi:hypothetical protein